MPPPPIQSHYSSENNQRNSAYFAPSGPQSMLMYASHGGHGSSQGLGGASGASSLPYISRSLSIDAYTQEKIMEQSGMLGSKKANNNNNNKNSELEEYAKRYEAINKQRRGSSMSRNSKILWQRNNSVPEESQNLSRSESVISNCSSNETLRYHESNHSFDSNETLIQPPLEFDCNSNKQDLKRFPLQTYASQGSLKKDLNGCGDANFSYLDPDKRLRVSDNTLKLIQKQALLDYYQRHSKVPSTGSGCSVKSENNTDSGFYSPTEPGPPGRLLALGSSEDHTLSMACAAAVINGTDHPDQSSTELNGLEVSSWTFMHL